MYNREKEHGPIVFNPVLRQSAGYTVGNVVPLPNAPASLPKGVPDLPEEIEIAPEKPKKKEEE